jgi:hypothetical protein
MLLDEGLPLGLGQADGNDAFVGVFHVPSLALILKIARAPKK